MTREYRRTGERELRHDDTPRSALPMRIGLIGSAIVGMAALVLILGRAQDARATRETPPATARVASTMAVPALPIASEAERFRMRAQDLAIDPTADRRGAAHPRSLATYRALRAYPGAPPRIPHGLTAQELHGTNCLNCHARGGYSLRFSAYAPVTPHPEWEACLQCHAPDDALAGTSLPGSAPDARCRQCHAAAQPQVADRSAAWRLTAWPALSNRASAFAPQDIPHDLELRGNCVACHAGPGAVAEIRTDHPERTDCRQCHARSGGDQPALAGDVPSASRMAGTP